MQAAVPAGELVTPSRSGDDGPFLRRTALPVIDRFDRTRSQLGRDRSNAAHHSKVSKVP